MPYMHLLKQLISYLILIIILLLPVLLWFNFSVPQPNISDMPNIIRSFGQLAGILGVNLFTLNFILSARFKIVENLLRGLNRVYVIHHTIGIFSLILLLFHPITLSLQYLSVSVEAVLSYLFPAITDYSVWLGISALSMLIILLFITLYLTTMEYQKWRFTHHLLGIPLFFAFLHIFFIPGNLTGNYILRYYLLFITAATLIIYTLRTVFSRYFVKHYKYKITSIEDKGEGILEIFMTAFKKSITFLPGQFIFVEFTNSAGIQNEPHPFSISTPPGTSRLGFAVKPLGNFTKTLKLLRPDSNVLIEGPYGRFISAIPGINNQIWIAGGIGITPFLSMARDLNPDTKSLIDLYYVVGLPEDAVFEKELLNISKNVPVFSLHPIYTKNTGRLNALKITEELIDFKDREIFLCGPQLMMKDLRNQFRELGCRNFRIHSEEFALR